GTQVQDPALAIDSAGQPHVVWGDVVSVTNGDAYYTKWNGSNWTEADGVTLGQTNVTNSTDALRPVIALDSNDIPIIVYTHDDGVANTEFRLEKWSGADWLSMNGVDSYDVLSDNAFDISQQ